MESITWVLQQKLTMVVAQKVTALQKNILPGVFEFHHNAGET